MYEAELPRFSSARTAARFGGDAFFGAAFLARVVFAAAGMALSLRRALKFSDVAGSGVKQVTFDRVAIERAQEYAAQRADVTMQL